MLRLVEPSPLFEQPYRAMLQEWQASGEPLAPSCLGLDCCDFPTFLQYLKERREGLNLPEGYVPDSTYWLVNQENELLGAVNVRHRLNEKLLLHGGHIGYGIRPSARRQGYATTLLALTLEKIQYLNLPRVLLTCDKDNIASAKVILKNGGILENELSTPDRITQRYLIHLPTHLNPL